MPHSIPSLPLLTLPARVLSIQRVRSAVFLARAGVLKTLDLVDRGWRRQFAQAQELVGASYHAPEAAPDDARSRARKQKSGRPRRA